MKRFALLVAVLLGTTLASRAGVHIGFGVSLPLPGLVISPPAPVYAAPPVYVAPAPTYYYSSPPVCVAPPVVVVSPRPYYYSGRWHGYRPRFHR